VSSGTRRMPSKRAKVMMRRQFVSNSCANTLNVMTYFLFFVRSKSYRFILLSTIRRLVRNVTRSKKSTRDNKWFKLLPSPKIGSGLFENGETGKAPDKKTAAEMFIHKKKRRESDRRT